MTAIKQKPGLYYIVVTHYAISACCFLALAVTMLFSANVFTGHYFHPHILQ